MKEVLLPVRIEELPEGGFLATSEDLPGLVATLQPFREQGHLRVQV